MYRITIICNLFYAGDSFISFTSKTNPQKLRCVMVYRFRQTANEISQIVLLDILV